MSTATIDRPTIGERYASAINSHHLEMREERPGDLDSLIAAGWIKDGIGPMLYRLAIEWDTVKAEHAQAQRFQAAEAAEVKRLRADAQRMPELAEEMRREAKWREDRAAATAVTEHALQLMQLRTLEPTKAALGRWAVVQATKRRFMQSDRVVLGIVGQVLRAHMDPLCRHCAGRGFNGGYGTPHVKCSVCRGTGKAAAALGKSDEQRAFAQHLLAEMDRMLSEVERLMRINKPAVREAKRLIGAAVHA